MDDTLYDGTGLPPEDTEELEQSPGPDQTYTAPDGDEADLLDWIRAGEGFDDRKARADAVWAKLSPETEEDKARISAELTSAAYSPEPTPNPEDQQAQSDGDGPPYEGGAEQSGPGADTGTGTPEAVAVPGQIVESDTAGTGEAVNADTGQVTAPGEPLPPVPDQGTGTPLDTPAPFDREQSEQQPT